MQSAPRIIKKYGNRRLYDTEESRYVNLERVADLVRDGEPVTVVDAKTGDDLTRQVLTQIIVETARDPQRGAPVEFLRDLIRASDDAQRDFLQWYLRSAAEAYEKLQSTWSERRAWPPSPRQWESWLRRWDPLALFQSLVPRESRDRGQGEDRAEAADAREELRDLQERLAALERKLAGRGR
ncbi:MAG TPA: polyhydroxyalkanoate synthesis regulator DNA-binding domain-containing protein [Thermoanaerobaculia bacterium]|nr:polyhydroxyalkanoate synthesis regulator DNA-binding domain-containing protein [Thermoanaerobaculia bacterium]